MSNLVYLIQFLKSSIFTQTVGLIDPPLFQMMSNDETLRMYITVAASRNYPNTNIENLSQSQLYPVMLLTKKEIYFALASVNARNIQSSRNGVQLSCNQRFDHYMSLIKQVEEEYKQLLSEGLVPDESGVVGAVTKHLRISDRYRTRYNYERTGRPPINLTVGRVTRNSVELRWDGEVSRFHSYGIYVSEHPIVDQHRPNHLAEGIKRLLSITDIHHKAIRLLDLQEDTLYYFAVSLQELTGIEGFAEVSLMTLTDAVGIDIQDNIKKVEVNSTRQLMYKFLPENAEPENVIWSSTNPSVAVVTSGGIITGVTEGIVFISAALESGVQDMISIEVVAMGSLSIYGPPSTISRPWDNWTIQDWFDAANIYHSERLSADAWDLLTDVKKKQALLTALTFLAAYKQMENFDSAVFEQALWMTTDAGEIAMNAYSSVSLSPGSLSVSWARGGGEKPVWISDLAWGLLFGTDVNCEV